MTVQVVLNTPLADALTGAIHNKLMEAGLAQTTDAAALAEYIILMLVNGKSQDEIVLELCTELLSLPTNDPAAVEFVAWMFQEAESLNGQQQGAAPPLEVTGDAMAGMGQEDEASASASAEMDTDMSATNDASSLNA